MNQPAYKSDMSGDARAHLLGAITSAYAAHDELMSDNRISALVEIDRTIALAHEARKFLLTPTGLTIEKLPDLPKPEEPRLL